MRIYNVLTKQQVLAFRGKLQDLLDEFGPAFGFQAKVGSCRYGDIATFKLEIAPIMPNGEAVKKEEADFARFAAGFGLEGQLGKTFKSRGKTFKVSGLKPGNRRYPVLATRQSDGKVFKFPAESIKNLLGLTKPVASVDCVP